MSISLGFEIRRRLNEGEKDFQNMDLKMVYLERVDLSNTNLEESDLSYANLKGANLSHANLKGAYLERANLTNADLSEANLEGCNLQNACLIGANLKNVALKNTNLCGARLRGSNLDEASWQKVYYDNNTDFGTDFKANFLENQKAYNLDTLSERQIFIKEILHKLNLVNHRAQRYLGGTLTAKYWQDSKSELDFLIQFFDIDSDRNIIFTGNYLDNIASIETKIIEKLTDKWLEEFTRTCSQVIPHFSKAIEEEQKEGLF
jgi:hypothetical protein